MNKDQLTAYLTLFVGGLIVGSGAFLFGDAYTTMHQIEAQGLLGQAIYEQRYEQALNEFRILIFLVVIGSMGIILGGFGYLVGELKAMMNE